MEYPQLKRAIEVIAALRHPKTGCPWDLAQTHQSLLKFLIEESYEFLYAVEQNDFEKMKDELGDVLLQILLHSKMADENGKFDIEDVAKNLADKMVYRHPHVFEDPALAKNPEEVKTNWERLKRESKKNKPYISIDDTHMPALISAHKIGYKSQKVNFDWENSDQVLEKVEEEFTEFKDELKDLKKNREKVKEELGDLFFSLAQLSRHLGFEAEEVLREANQKFVNRFIKVESKARAQNKDMSEMPSEELEKLWIQVKKEIKSKG